MKMVLVTPFIETRGGVDRVVLKIAKHFNAKIFCVRYNPDSTFKEFDNLEINVAPPTFFSKFPYLKRVVTAASAGNYFYNLKLDDYDVINAHQTPSEWIRNKNPKVLWYCHSPNREAFDLYSWRMKRRGIISKAVFWSSIQAFKHFEYQTVPKIEYIFTNSENSKNRLKKYLNRSDSEILYPGVDHEKFSNRGNEKYFFYPSRIVPEKDFEYAIEAFKIFSKRVPGWKLVIAGTLSTNQDHKKYLKKISSLMPNAVSIETNVEEERLIDLYSRCSAVVFTPINEDYGLVPLEAMASSKLCIAKAEGGPKETIVDGKDGFLVDSIWKLAKAMEWVANNPENAILMGKFGKEKVKKDFSWEKYLKRFETKAKEISDSH